VFTIAGRAYSDTRGQRATAHRGQLVLLSPAISPRWDVVPGRVWEILFLKLEPMPWVPPPAFDPVSRGLYEARVTSARRLQRMHDAFGRIRADSRDQATAQVLRLSDSGRRTIGAEDSPHREGRGGQSDGLREGNWDPIEPQLMASTLNEILLLTAKDPLDGVTLDARVAAALERLGSYLAADHTLDSLAREASLSASRFAHLFREQVGIPPMRMLLHLRLQEAALRLLHSDDAISLIAEEIGFTSSFDFSRQFRRQYGVSPRAYRSMSRSTGSDS
jgi:AraC-like DNA-binding protein